ncbi:hypothetical protein C8F04DRAFT_1269720 [Mycena alexandri]|uniref:Uncharacterized protein n=1 Tax=Mycena alexandri TaxID=1745969 RepID=A0AAD6SBU9_9AGAR|nr:hypothetical protein C8F04DRAFT_1269720 [Mycena alexandri]
MHTKYIQATEPVPADDPPRVRSPTPSGQSAVPFSALIARSATTFQAPAPTQLPEATPLDPAAYPPLPPAGEDAQVHLISLAHLSILVVWSIGLGLGHLGDGLSLGVVIVLWLEACLFLFLL